MSAAPIAEAHFGLLQTTMLALTQAAVHREPPASIFLRRLVRSRPDHVIAFLQPHSRLGAVRELDTCGLKGGADGG